jgi:hypothetical protein
MFYVFCFMFYVFCFMFLCFYVFMFLCFYVFMFLCFYVFLFLGFWGLGLLGSSNRLRHVADQRAPLGSNRPRPLATSPRRLLISAMEQAANVAPGALAAAATFTKAQLWGAGIPINGPVLDFP